MLRCECRARLGRGWRFCETCGRPVPEDLGVAAPEPGIAVSGEPVSPASPTAQPVETDSALNSQVPATAAPWLPKPPAMALTRLDWRFALLPVFSGFILGLPLLLLSPWCAPVGVVLGLSWAWRELRRSRQSLHSFTQEWIFDKVEVYGPCAMGIWAWWPTGVLYLTEQTLKFKPFGHSKECEVSLDPARITGIEFPSHFFSWPPDWAGMLVSSSYGPVFGTLKVFDRIRWGQVLQAARQKTADSSDWEPR